MPTVRAALDALQAADRVVVPPGIDAVLLALDVVTPDPIPTGTATFAGTAKARTEITLLGFASFALDPNAPPIDFTLTVQGTPATPTGFRIDLTLGDRVKLPAFLRRAVLDTTGGSAVVKPDGTDPVRLTGLVALRIEGSETATASARFVVPGSDNAVVTVALSPPVVLFGETEFGLDLAGGLVIDDSTTEGPTPLATPSASDDPAWRGIAIRQADFYFPVSTPLLGGRPVKVAFALGSPVGLDAHAEATIPADGDRPEVRVAFTWYDPTAASLADCLPTLVEAVARFPVNGKTAGVNGELVNLNGPAELVVRGRFARDVRVSPPTMSFALGVDRGGPDGLISVTTTGNVDAAKIVVTAAALAAAFMADAGRPHPAPDGDPTATTVGALLLAATALSSTLISGGKLVIHGIEVEGAVGPADKVLRFHVDYSVDVVVEPIKLATMSISMDDKVPMRVRYRNVVLEVDFAKSGLDRFDLSYAAADFGVEDPGKWLIAPPGSLFDVLGTRSGRGSTWFEVDLRFALDLGPVKVSGATVRATFDSGGKVSVGLRGLDARIDLSGLVTGGGSATLHDSALDATVAASLVPLGIGAMAILGYEEKTDTDGNKFNKILLGVAIDLPGPIPLLNTGLGIFGFQGVFGINATFPKPTATADPTDALLAWRPWQHDSVLPQRGELVFGLGVSIGTVPDLGFAFSAKALVLLAVPDFAIRASIEARVMNEPVKMADIDGDPPPAGLRLLGAFAADNSGVMAAIRGTYQIPRLLDVLVPFGAYFPTHGSDWYLHLGTDGFAGRTPGPIRVTVLPGLLDIEATAYLMVRGNGIPNFAGTRTNLDGFAIGFGFSWKQSLGFVIVRLDLAASAAVGLGTHPLMFIGHGELSGSLHLGPVSLGVSAGVDVQVGPTDDDLWVALHVCGEVDLFFFSISGCIDLSVGGKSDVVPDPTQWPLTRVALTDRQYGDAGDAAEGDPNAAPVVWPDVIPMLEFSNGPACGLTDGPFLEALSVDVSGNRVWTGTSGGDGAYGSHDLKYTFTLTRVDLFEVDPGTLAATPVGGDLEAAWQLPKHGDATTAAALPGARELALLTWQPHLWTRVLPDGGVGLPHDPVPGLENHCRIDLQAVPWWAVGVLATRAAAGEWDVPPEPAGNRRFVSEFHVRLTAEFAGVALTPVGVYGLPFPVAFDLGGPGGYGAAADIDDHSFTGGLRLPRAIRRAEKRGDDPLDTQLVAGVTALLKFDRRVEVPLVVVAVGGKWVPNSDDPGVEVTGLLSNGTTELFKAVAVRPGPGGRTLAEYAPRTKGSFRGARVRYDARLDLDLVGVRGLTDEATAAADAAQGGAAAGSGGLTTAAGDPPGTHESLLKPGTLYKIVVEERATGSRPSGVTKDFAEAAREFWFRTAPVPPPPPPTPPPTPPPLPDWRNVFHIREAVVPAGRPGGGRPPDTFDPAYLQRYLLGYTPTDHTRHWFCDDPVAVHFRVDYVPAFAALYGRGFAGRCQRTDLPPATPTPSVFVFTAADVGALAAPHLATAVDRRLLALSGPTDDPPCPIPSTGSTAGGKPLLEPRGTYDLSVAFPLAGDPQSGNELPGVVFTTSRWRNPEELFTDLGFGSSGHPPGDVPSPAGAVPVTGIGPGEVVGDAALELALARLGATRWPPPAVPRTTAFWIPDGGTWNLAAVLLEAPEPIHRPAPPGGGVARVTIADLTCEGITFDTVVRDGSGARLLFLTATPLAPGLPFSFLFLSGAEQTYSLDGPPAGPVPFTRLCPIRHLPAFAEDFA